MRPAQPGQFHGRTTRRSFLSVLVFQGSHLSYLFPGRFSRLISLDRFSGRTPMPAKCSFIICSSLLFCLALLTSCVQSPTTNNATPTRAATFPTVLSTLSPTLSATPGATPTHFKTRVLLSHFGRPDDLVFDLQGHLVFSDFYKGTI